jgi:hypothetical protein
MDHLYLFAVCPNNSGSTLIAKLLGTSPAVSLLKNSLHEGVCVTRARSHMPVSQKNERGNCTINEEKFMNPDNYRWEKIAFCWREQWNMKRPILVEKSPQNLLRTQMMAEAFPNSKFIISLRNPYAFCEGVHRKFGYDHTVAAEHWVKCAQHQIQNIKTLENSIFFTYEELCDRTATTCDKIVRFVPELKKLNPHRSFRRKRYERIKGLKNLNTVQISRLRVKDVRNINTVLAPNRKLLERFGYELVSHEKHRTHQEKERRQTVNRGVSPKEAAKYVRKNRDKKSRELSRKFRRH